MVLYLSSQKFGNDTGYLEEWLCNHDNKILLIYNALEAKGEAVIQRNSGEDKELLEKIGFDVKVIDLKNYFGKEEKLESDFKKYSACCVMGGNVFILRQAMKYSGFDNFLKNKRNKDYLYIGYSSGACVLSKDINILNRVDAPISFYQEDDIIYRGLGLIDYVFIPHYQSNYHKVHLIEEVVERCKENNINYKAVKDGEVIIETLI